MQKNFARLILLALCLIVPAFAAQAQGLKIGVLDMKQVTERSTAIQQMVARAEAPLKAQQDKIDAKYREFEQQSTQLSARRSALNDESLKAEEEKLRRLREEIEDMDTEVRRQVARLAQEVMKPAVSRILQIVTEVAKREGFELVLPSETVLYHVGTIDITAMVIQTLDREGPEALESAAKRLRDSPAGEPASGQKSSGGKSDAGDRSPTGAKRAPRSE